MLPTTSIRRSKAGVSYTASTLTFRFVTTHRGKSILEIFSRSWAGKAFERGHKQHMQHGMYVVNYKNLLDKYKKCDKNNFYLYYKNKLYEGNNRL